MPGSWVKICYPAPEEMIEAVIKNMGDLDSRRQKTRKREVSHFSKDHWLEQHCQIFTEVL